MNNQSDIYYRLYKDKNENLCVVCMQWFDEFGYDQTRFITETKYQTEEEANQALSKIQEGLHKLYFPFFFPIGIGKT